MTAACYSLWKHHLYLRFKLDTCCPEIFRNAPFEYTGNQFDRTIVVDYGWARTDCDHRSLRFVDSFYLDLEDKLGLCNSHLECWNPQIWLTKEEIDAVPFQKPYCCITSGWKRDYEIKNLGFETWQAVVDWIIDELKIDVVQLGEHNPPWHVHRPLRGAINHIGKTNTRQLYAIAYKSLFGLGGESYLHHVYGSSFWLNGREARKGIPFVCCASGWNPKLWPSYLTEVYLTRQGQLDCCRFGGCNVAKLNDCKHRETVGDEPVGLCMKLITPDEIIKAIKDYKTGGLI